MIREKQWSNRKKQKAGERERERGGGGGGRERRRERGREREREREREMKYGLLSAWDVKQGHGTHKRRQSDRPIHRLVHSTRKSLVITDQMTPLVKMTVTVVAWNRKPHSLVLFWAS